MTENEKQLRARVGIEPGQDWPAYAWPGGYPIIYYTATGDAICASCVPGALETDDPPTMADIYYEGPSEWCANCNAELESAYGDPDAEENQDDTAA